MSRRSDRPAVPEGGDPDAWRYYWEQGMARRRQRERREATQRGNVRVTGRDRSRAERWSALDEAVRLLGRDAGEVVERERYTVTTPEGSIEVDHVVRSVEVPIERRR